MHPAGPGEHVLDVETLSIDFSPRRSRASERVSCCVVHDVAGQQDLVFACVALPQVPGAAPLEALYHFLEACRSEGCTLVGHNLRGFDWPVLAAEFEARGLLPRGTAGTWGPGAARLVDTQATLHAKLGWRPGLHALALHNLGEGKSMSGALAPGMWREGRHTEVVAYCRQDVALTLALWRLGREQGSLVVEELQDGTRRAVEVAW